MSSNLFSGQSILFTVACGHPKYAKQAMALAMSIRLHGAQTPIVLLSDIKDPEIEKWFDAVVSPVPGVEPYLQKVVALQTTGADDHEGAATRAEHWQADALVGDAGQEQGRSLTRARSLVLTRSLTWHLVLYYSSNRRNAKRQRARTS